MGSKGAGQRNCLGAVAALLAALVSISCGGGTAGTSQTASTTSTSLTLNTSSIDFGNVSVGSSKNGTITLTNSSASGGPSVTFSQVTAAGSSFTASTSALPIVLTPGASSTITITFAPKSAGAATGSLSMVVAGAADPSTVSLSGTGVGTAQLAVAPSALNFGNVAVGSSANLSGTLTAGASSITVASAGWNGQGYSVSGITFPLTVAAGTSVSFTVTFTPQAAGSAPGSISFASNASNSPANETFSGNGTQTAAIQHRVDLSWLASSSAVSGYNVYRGTLSGGPYAKVDSMQPTTSYADSTVQSGATYYYVVTSVGTDSVESPYSNQVTAIVPSP
jgi:Abnormal spindle-like microcephaly-assoc'd, ASPM-SPD-2-Hydin